jgi:hypothetical protein
MKKILLTLMVFGSFGAFANPTSGWDEGSDGWGGLLFLLGAWILIMIVGFFNLGVDKVKELKTKGIKPKERIESSQKEMRTKKKASEGRLKNMPNEKKIQLAEDEREGRLKHEKDTEEHSQKTLKEEKLSREMLFTDCKDTLDPEKYCEGVWGLRSLDGGIYSSLKFHTERGGDPDVWIDWIKHHPEVMSREDENYAIYR